MLPVDTDGCKVKGRIIPQNKIKIHIVDGVSVAYQLSACMVSIHNTYLSAVCWLKRVINVIKRF